MRNHTISFNDSLKYKAPLYSFLGYILLTVLATAVMMQIWMPADASVEQVSRLAETDPFVIFWGGVIGIVSCLMCSMFATKLSKQKGLKNAAAFGGLLVLYGVLSILAHPEHSLLYQISKVVVPVPLAIFGGYLYLRLMFKK